MFHCIECGKNLDEINLYEKVKNKCNDSSLNKKLNVSYVESFLQTSG